MHRVLGDERADDNPHLLAVHQRHSASDVDDATEARPLKPGHQVHLQLLELSWSVKTVALAGEVAIGKILPSGLVEFRVAGVCGWLSLDEFPRPLRAFRGAPAA